MKTFISENWYKLLIGSSLFMASFGFMIHSISPSFANESQVNTSNTTTKVIPTNADGTITVRLSEEQIDQIIPKNENGTIDVNISSSSEQLDVNIEKLDGYSVRGGNAYLPVRIED